VEGKPRREYLHESCSLLQFFQSEHEDGNQQNIANGTICLEKGKSQYKVTNPCFLLFIHFLLSFIPTDTAINRTDKWQSASVVESLQMETRVGNHPINYDGRIDASTLPVSSI